MTTPGKKRTAAEKPRVGLVHSPHPVFEELAAALTLQLSQTGWDCFAVRGIPATSRDLDLVLLIGDVAMLPWVDAMLANVRARNIPTLLWQLEPLPPRPLNDNALATVRRLYPVLRAEHIYRSNRARRLANRFFSWQLARQAAGAFGSAHLPADRYRLQLVSRSFQWAQDSYFAGRVTRILAGMQAGAALLGQAGIQAKYVPVGYHPLLGTLRPHVERDLDVVFFGSVTDERATALRDIESRLGKVGYCLTVVSDNCYGETRIRLLNRTKIVLNLLNYPWEFPSLRLVMAMACGCMVISVSNSDPAPFRDGGHFIQTAPDSICGTLLQHLANEDERNVLAQQGHAFVTGEMTMRKTIVPEIERMLEIGPG